MMKKARSPSPVTPPTHSDGHGVVDCKQGSDTESSHTDEDLNENEFRKKLGEAVRGALGFGSSSSIMPREEERTVLTSWADDYSVSDSKLLLNVVGRVRERASILSYFVCGSGWLWVKVGTEVQAKRAYRRLDGVTVLGGAHVIRCQMTAPRDWPSDMMLPQGERTVPALPRNPQKTGERTQSGGVRHSASARAILPPPPPPPPPKCDWAKKLDAIPALPKSRPGKRPLLTPPKSPPPTPMHPQEPKQPTVPPPAHLLIQPTPPWRMTKEDSKLRSSSSSVSVAAQPQNPAVQMTVTINVPTLPVHQVRDPRLPRR